VHLDARRHIDPTPRRSWQRRRENRRARRRLPSEQLPDLVERATRLLERFDLQQPIEMLAAVVVAAPKAEGRRQQPLLNVITNRPSRDACEIGELADRIQRIGHEATM
jgi:hypothetical protein